MIATVPDCWSKSLGPSILFEPLSEIWRFFFCFVNQNIAIKYKKAPKPGTCIERHASYLGLTERVRLLYRWSAVRWKGSWKKRLVDAGEWTIAGGSVA